MTGSNTSILGRLKHKKVLYCFLSGLLSSLLIYYESYRPKETSLILPFALAGLIPGLLFPISLLMAEREINLRKAKIFISITGIVYILFAIALWLTTMHNYSIPIAIIMISVVYPYVMLAAYFNLIKRVRHYQRARNSIILVSLGSTIVFLTAAFLKVHYFHHHVIFEERMENYFLFSVWSFPIWQTGFAIVLTKEEENNIGQNA